MFRSDDNPTIQGCVASGIGYWATPLLTVDTDDPAVAVVPIEPAPEPRHIALAWPATRRSSPAVGEFVDVAEEVCRAVEQRLADVLPASAPARRTPGPERQPRHLAPATRARRSRAGRDEGCGSRRTPRVAS